MKKETVKTMAIIILLIVIIALLSMQLLKPDRSAQTSRFLKDIMLYQTRLSVYLGTVKTDTFGAYKVVQILAGATDLTNVESTKIKNNKDEELLSLIDTTSKKIHQEVTYYKINADNFEKALDVKLTENIQYYISETGDIRMTYKNTPNWWQKELNIFYLST